MSNALLAIGVIVWAVVLSLPRVRGFLGRHRVWVAVAVLPLQPFLLVGLIARLTSGSDIEAKYAAPVVLAYVNGLVAFALVTGFQDAMRVDRTPTAREPAQTRGSSNRIWGVSIMAASLLVIVSVIGQLPGWMVLAVIVLLIGASVVAARRWQQQPGVTTVPVNRSRTSNPPGRIRRS